MLATMKMELSLGGAIDGLAIYGADVYAGHKCESYASDGTFCEANVGLFGVVVVEVEFGDMRNL